MKIFKCLNFCIAIFISNTALCEENINVDSKIFFSDSKYDISKIHHSIEMLGFIVEDDKATYSVIKLRESPSGLISYKLYAAKGNNLKKFDLLELKKYEYVKIGKMGSNDSGKLIIPCITGSGNAVEVSLYELQDNKLSFIPDILPGKNIQSALHDNDMLFLIDRLGALMIKKTNRDFEGVDGIVTDTIQDVRKVDNIVYLLATNTRDNNFIAKLISLNLSDNKIKSLAAFDVDKKYQTYGFEFDSFKKDNLFVSITPKVSPEFNPSASLVQINLKTGAASYDFTYSQTTSDVGINLACKKGSEKIKTPVVVYSKFNGKSMDLIVRYSDRDELLNAGKNEYIYSINSKFKDGFLYILYIYKDLVGRYSYTELSQLRVESENLVSCSWN